MDFKAVYEQISKLYLNLTKQQRIIVITTMISVVAFIAFLVVFRTGSEEFDDGYRVLFDEISSKDTALIVQQLEKEEIPYKLTDETTIKVPKEYVYKQRLKAAELGLPKNSTRVGFELFDKKEFGSTEFDQTVKYLRALEGELAKTIESLSPIYRATVHLAIPKESVFVAKQIPPTASVVLMIQDSMILNSKQVRGIKNLVASSVARLESTNVQIVDENGEPLGDNEDASKTDELAKIQLNYKKKFERNLEQKIMKLLSPIIGSKDRVVAKVTVEFDFTIQKQEEEKYDPVNVVRSEQLMEEKREGKKPKQVGGVPGAVSNIGPVQGIGTETMEKYEKSDTTKNYEISKLTSSLIREFAVIKRITTAVVVDGKYKEEITEEGISEIKFYKLSDKQMASITDMVKQVVGFTTSRKDEIVVTNFQFDLDKNRESMMKSDVDIFLERTIPFLPYLKYLFAIIVLFIFYKLVIIPFLNAMLEIKSEEDEDTEALAMLGDLEDDEDDMSKLNDLRNKIEKEMNANNEMDEDSLRAEVMLSKIKEAIQGNPEEGATLLASLLDESEESQANQAMQRGAQ